MQFAHWPLLAALILTPAVSGAEGPAETSTEKGSTAEDGFESRAERRRRERSEAAAAEDAAIEALEKKVQAQPPAPQEEESSGGCD